MNPLPSFFGEPTFQYSLDEGKTWNSSTLPQIGPKVRMRIVTKDGITVYSAHAVEVQKTCDCCDGTGTRFVYQFQQDARR